MHHNNDILLLDIHPKFLDYGSLKYSPASSDNYFEYSDPLLFDQSSLSSQSPLSFDIPDDFNEYNEALLSKLIEEFNQDPLLNPNEFDYLIADNLYFDNCSLDYTPASIENCTSNSRKRKHKLNDCDIFEETFAKKPIKEKINKNNNNDAAFRYRQKQKFNKSKLEEDLNQCAVEMVNAKNDMLEMRKKLNTVKNIVKDLLIDKGVINF